MAWCGSRAICVAAGCTRVHRSGRKSRSAPSRRRGIALAWTALVLFVMIGIVGLGIDLGWAVLDAHWLQNAGDAGALAGAMLVKNAYHDGTLDTVYDAARQLTLANRAANEAVDVCFDAGTNDPSLDVVVGRWFMADHYFEPLVLGSGDVPNAVKVVTRHVDGWSVNQPLRLFFGPVFGVQTANVLRDAVAISTGGGGAALVCLAPEGVGLSIPGGARILVCEGPVRGEIWVDSFWRTPDDKDDAVYPTPNSAPDPVNGWYIDCAALNTCGTVDPSIMEYFGGEPPNNLYPVLEKLPTPIPDPLAWLPALDVAAMNPLDAGTPYGMVVEVDPTTGIPLTDPDGDYIPATHRESGQTFDVSAGDPIRSSTIDDFGQLIGGVRQTLTVTPGYYPGGFDQQNSGANFKTIRMLPGVYAVGGGSSPPGNSGLILNGGALDAEGVMIYVTNSSLDGTGNWGQVNISGNYEYINLTEYVYLDGDPLYYKDYDYLTEKKGAGMAIFQDRRNPRDAVIVGGDDNMVMGGTLYFHCTGQEAGMVTAPLPGSVPAGTWDVTVEVGGTSGQTGIQLITDRVRVHGDSDLIIKYDGRNFQPADEALLVK